MIKKIIFLILIVVLIVLVFTVFKKEQWSGYFYPDASNLSDWIESDEIFDSLEQCRAWAEDTGFDLGIESTTYDYECGLNCKYKNGLNICEETLD